MNPNQAANNDSTWCIPKIGRVQTCNFYEPDNVDNNDTNTIVFEVSFAHAIATSDEKQVACYFASALCAFCPTLTTLVKNALEYRDVAFNIIRLPSGANNASIDLDVVEKYNQTEIFTLMGSCLIAFLENVSRVDYDSFVTERVHVLARKLGMPDDKISSFKYPLQVPQVTAVRNTLFSEKNIRTEVLKYLIWCSERSEKIALMARYVCQVLSRCGMENFSCIYNKLAMTRSPVLLDEEVCLEVVNLTKAARNILVYGSEFPQRFYWYFCSDSERFLLESDRFPILLAVAQELKKDEVNTRTISRLVSTGSTTSGVVERLVKIHRDFENNSSKR